MQIVKLNNGMTAIDMMETIGGPIVRFLINPSSIDIFVKNNYVMFVKNSTPIGYLNPLTFGSTDFKTGEFEPFDGDANDLFEFIVETFYPAAEEAVFDGSIK